MYRDHTKTVKIGNRVIGGGNPVLIQSMTNTKTEDVEATVNQINRLAAAGCDIIRCAVPTMEAAHALTEIKKQITIPLVADIHFDYRLAIAAMEDGSGQDPDQSGKYRQYGACACRRGCGKGTADPDPGRGQQRFSGKRDRGDAIMV